MNQPQPTLTLDDYRTKSNAIHKARAEARRDFERYAEQEADAERLYRQQLAQAFAKAKASDATAAQAEIQAHSDASDARHTRDLAKAMAKAALLRIEALEADRATLRSVAEWSQKVDAVGVGGVAA